MGTPIQVEVRKLDDILLEKGFEHVDLLSIDTEGTELDVLQTITLDGYRPQIIIIEWSTWSEVKNTEREIMDTFYPLPYRMVHRTEGNSRSSSHHKEVEAAMWNSLKRHRVYIFQMWCCRYSVLRCRNQLAY